MGRTRGALLVVVVVAVAAMLAGAAPALAHGGVVGEDLQVAASLGDRELTVVIRRVGAVPGPLRALLLWPRPPAVVDLTARAGPHQVRLLIETSAVGARDVVVDVAAPRSVERLVVAPTMVEMGHAVAPVPAIPTAPGRFLAPGVEFFMAGRWDVAVTVHGPEGTAEVAFPVLIAP